MDTAGYETVRTMRQYSQALGVLGRCLWNEGGPQITGGARFPACWAFIAKPEKADQATSAGAEANWPATRVGLSPRLYALDWALGLDSQAHVEHDAPGSGAADGIEVGLDELWNFSY
jgi:hypothetical protein